MSGGLGVTVYLTRPWSMPMPWARCMVGKMAHTTGMAQRPTLLPTRTASSPVRAA